VFWRRVCFSGVVLVSNDSTVSVQNWSRARKRVAVRSPGESQNEGSRWIWKSNQIRRDRFVVWH
jgi:hypothetical protein